ncbi:MAG: hypothetical protein KGP12_09380 [Actinomycetales bacterium]|nr:hypothetical protein [Actinomycetales bacterium]
MTADLLAGILQLLLEAGGWLHPGAWLRARDGELSVHCSAPDGEPLVVVPAAAMVRVGRVEWSSVSDSLAFAPMPEALDGIELEMLYLHAALLNQCQKVPTLVRTHPALAAGLSDGLVHAVRAFRPSFRTRQAQPASVLWSTRCFRLTVGSGSPEPVAVPVIDLIDHHRGGASGQELDDGLRVPVQHPGGDSACFLDYGWQRDAIGTALVYGFADRSADIAHSAPLALEIAGVGRVRIEARGRDATGRLLPIRAERSADQTVISHLGFGPSQRPVDRLTEAAGWTRQAAESVTAAIAEANLALVRSLERHAAAQPEHPAAMLLAEAARVQARMIEEHAGSKYTPDEPGLARPP